MVYHFLYEVCHIYVLTTQVHLSAQSEIYLKYYKLIFEFFIFSTHKFYQKFCYLYICTHTCNLSFSFWQQSRTQILKSSGVIGRYSSTSICLRKTSNMSLKFDEAYNKYIYLQLYFLLHTCLNFLIYIISVGKRKIQFTYIFHHPFVLLKTILASHPSNLILVGTEEQPQSRKHLKYIIYINMLIYI